MITPPTLVNKVAVVTGGTAGLGAAVARAFANLDARVVINYSADADRAKSLLKELEDISSAKPSVPPHQAYHQTHHGRQHVALKADMGSRDEISRLVEETVARMGRIDIVFSNHGWTKPTNFNNLTENTMDEDWDKCFNMNVKSHLYLAEASQKYLQETGGSFITTSSTAGMRPTGSSLVCSQSPCPLKSHEPKNGT